MPTAVQNFFVRVFKTYASSFLKLVPYLALLFVFLTFVFFAQYSTALFLVLIPGTFFRIVFNVLGIVFYVFISFMITISMIRVITAKYTTSVLPKVFKNIKESFFITLKNVFIFAFLLIPAILAFIFYFIGKMGYLSPNVLGILFILLILSGVLIFFWLSFVIVILALEQAKGMKAVSKSVSIVNGRFTLVFARLFMLFLFLFVTFYFYNDFAYFVTQGTLFYLIFMFVFAILSVPFYPVGFSVLYLDFQNEDMKKEALEENLLS